MNNANTDFTTLIIVGKKFRHLKPMKVYLTDSIARLDVRTKCLFDLSGEEGGIKVIIVIGESVLLNKTLDPYLSSN